MLVQAAHPRSRVPAPGAQPRESAGRPHSVARARRPTRRRARCAGALNSAGAAIAQSARRFRDVSATFARRPRCWLARQCWPCRSPTPSPS